MKSRALLIGFAGVLLAVVSWLGWHWYTTPRPPQVRLEGIARQTAEAIEKALDEVRREPRSGPTWGKLGMVLYANGFTDQGVSCLAQASRLDPKEPTWVYWQGKAALPSDPKKGIAYLEQALRQVEGIEQRSAIHFTLAQALVEDGQFVEAERHALALKEIYANDPRARWAFGLAALGREDYAAAREHLSALTDSPFARKRACGLLAGLVEEKDKAMAYRKRVAELPADYEWPDVFETALLAYREDPNGRLAEYRELVAQGRKDEAMALISKLVAESPDEPVCYMLGTALLSRNELGEAERAFRKALEFNQRNAKTHLMLTHVLLLRGEKERSKPLFEQAVAVADEAIRLESGLAFAHWVRGLALKHLNRTGESLAALRQAVLLGPESPEFHQSLGEALAEAGQIKEALEHLENAVRHAKPANVAATRQALEKWSKKAKTFP